jgi:hypothetical protein
VSNDDDKKPSADDILLGKGGSGNDDKPLKGNTHRDLKPEHARRAGHAPRGMGPSLGGGSRMSSATATRQSLDQRSPEKSQEKDTRPIAHQTGDKDVDRHYGKDHQLKDGKEIDALVEKERRKAELKERQKAERTQDKSKGRDDEGR